jgi:hypothetical protein
MKGVCNPSAPGANSVTGCVKVPANEGNSCNDRKGCTTFSTCQAGQCVGVDFKDCDDYNPCTVDECYEGSEGGSCTHKAGNDGASCDDGAWTGARVWMAVVA